MLRNSAVLGTVRARTRLQTLSTKSKTFAKSAHLSRGTRSGAGESNGTPKRWLTLQGLGYIAASVPFLWRGWGLCGGNVANAMQSVWHGVILSGKWGKPSITEEWNSYSAESI